MRGPDTRAQENAEELLAWERAGVTLVQGGEAFDAEDFARESRQAAQKDFAVLPENWEAVGLFLRVNTQWLISPAGGPLDLNYSAVDVILNRLRLDPEPADFERLMVLGRAAAGAMLERSKNG